ncbi:MAG TPA: delta-60 repeat domain-containing protein [Planctomycetota bacterium]|nr:delta-60 repeat domain-containing protein [Planctomycetota bacterium]
MSLRIDAVRLVPSSRTLAPALVAALLLSLSASAQLLPGDLDPSFGVGGKLMLDFNGSTDIAEDVAVQPDGKLVVVGLTYVDNDFSNEDFAVLRLMPDGTPDPSFGVNGRVTTDFPGLAAVASAVVVQPDGKLVVAGGAFPLFTFLGDFELVRYNPDGSLDTSFGVGGIVTTSFPGQGSYAFDVALQPDGKIVAAGTDYVNFSSQQSSNTDFALARYLADGTPDPSFGVGGKVTTDFQLGNDDVHAVLVQPDGKLVAVGAAIDIVKFLDFAAARYLPDGTLDGSFGTGGKTQVDFGTFGTDVDHDEALAAALQPDGKIVAAGFTIFDLGIAEQFALVRWNSDGTLDSSFSDDGMQQIDFGSFLQDAWDVEIQANGKIVATGFADTESSDSDFLLARCNPDGSLDTTFSGDGKVRTSFGALNGGAHASALQPDGRIVAAGFQAAGTVEFALSRYIGDPQAWVDKDGALAGTPGLPVLVAAGDLAAGSSDSIDLFNAQPSATAALFVATSSQPTPFKGGVLQAFPPAVIIFAVTSAEGTVPLDFTVPAGLPSGLEVWLQWGIQDAGAVKGVALSNAVMGVAP